VRVGAVRGQARTGPDSARGEGRSAGLRAAFLRDGDPRGVGASLSRVVEQSQTAKRASAVGWGHQPWDHLRRPRLMPYLGDINLLLRSAEHGHPMQSLSRYEVNSYCYLC